MKTCATCRFFFTRGPDADYGECHHYEPYVYGSDGYWSADFNTQEADDSCEDWKEELS